MNACKDLRSLRSAFLLSIALIVFVAAGGLQADVAEQVEVEGETQFNKDQEGYDKHADIFYYQDEPVDREYARENYLVTKRTLAGQRADVNLRAVKPAANPFGVGQRTFKPLGILMDRWDVKETGEGAQYFALYHGHGSTSVVNKVRAHLLRALANALDNYLPSLDRLAKSDASDNSNPIEEDPNVEALFDEIRGTIERVFRQVDGIVRETMADSDDSMASATVAIVSKEFVITASVGAGKVIAYDRSNRTKSLTAFENDNELNNLFGLKKSRKEYIYPHVEFHSRRTFEFLLIESPPLANSLDDESASSIVLREIEQFKDEPSEEQELYSQSLIDILDWVENQLSGFHRFFMHSDYSVILVGFNANHKHKH